MANIVSSNNLTSLYGSGQTTIITSTPVANVAGTIPSRNLTTLYSGGGNPVQAVLPYGNSNVVSLLNAGTDGGNTITNIVATGNITANYYFGNGYYLTGVGNSGNSSFSNYANYAGNVVISAQPNITSLGTLTGLISVGNVNLTGASNVSLGPVANVHITGGSANYVLTTDGAGNLSWALGSSGNANTANFANFAGNVTVSAQPNITSIGTLTSLSVSGNITSGNANLGNLAIANFFSGDGSLLSNINGSNVNNVANANYANFAGTLINGNSNITILPNAQILFATAGTANVATLNNGTIALIPQSNVNNGLTISTYGNSAVNDVHRISSFRYRGNITTPTSVQPNDATMRFLTAGSNGTALQTNSTASIRALVDSSYTANGANIPLGWTIQVNDTNGGINNQQKTHQFQANGRVNLAGLLNTGNGITSTITENSQGMLQQIFNNSNSQTAQWTSWRYRGTSSSPLPVISGDEVLKLTGAVYADSGNTYVNTGDIKSRVQVNDGAGNVSINMEISTYFPNSKILLTSDTINAIGNLNTTGNFTSLNANLGNLVVANFFSGDGGLLSNINGANISNVANANFAAYAGNVTVNAQPNITSVGTLTSLSVSGNITSGNANLGNLVVANFFSGNGSLLTGIISTGGNSNYANYAGNLINGTSNISIPIANGNITFSSNSNANLVTIETGGILINAAPLLSQNNGLRFTSVGRGGNAAGASRLYWAKQRGTIAVPLSVNPSDFTAEIITTGSNGTAQQTNSIASIRAQVDSSYTANGANIPIGWQITVNDTNGGVNNQTKTHNFYSNGTVNFANSISVSGSGNISGTTVSVTGNITGGNLITGGFVSATGNITGGNLIIGNITATGGTYSFSNGAGGATSLILNGDKTTNSQFGINESQFSVTMSNVDTTTGFSPFRFQQYAPNNNRFGSMFYYRSRGNDFFTSAPVVASDKIMEYNFIVNSNNVTTSIGTFVATVNYNDNAGNVGTKLDFGAIGSGTTGYLNGVINLLANTTNANNFVATSSNVGNSKLNQFQETVYAIGSTSGTITPDFNNGSIQSLTLTGSITLNSLTNSIAGRSMTLILTQGGAGSYTLTSSMLYATGYKTLSTAIGAKDIISVFYDGTTYFASLTTGYV